LELYETLLQKLAPHWEEDITIKRNEFLLKEGDFNSNTYLILSGSVRVFILDQEGIEHTIRFGYSDSFTGALDTFLVQKPTKFYIQTIKETKLQRMSKARFSSFLMNAPENQGLWQQFLELLVHQQLEREIDLITYTPKERLMRVLERSPQLFQEIPQKHIASYLRMTPETLSRILKNLERSKH
jgi:CRP-like cAMP-binding protein